MKNYLSKEEIETELASNTNKPKKYKSNIAFPFNDLSDRQFEILVYSIFKEEIKSGDFNGFDEVNLMQGTGERGRDCILHYKNKVVGAIQCKKYTSRVTKPQIAKEVIKFVIHSILDKSLIPNPENFCYYFAVSDDYTESALKLISDFNTTVYLDDDYEGWVNDVLNKYKSFDHVRFEDINENLKTRLMKIKISKLNASDLNIRLTKHKHLVSYFFEVEKVVAIEENKRMIMDVVHPIPKLIELDEFKSLQAKKSNKLPYSNHFVGRNTEIDTLIQSVLSGKKILIIDGVPGIGKTRFTIEIANRIRTEMEYDKVLVINDTVIRNDISLIVEIDRSFKYVILVDDANRIDDLHRIKELIFNHNFNTDPIIVLNTRSYNIEMVCREINSWGIDSVKYYTLKKLKNFDIDKILHQKPFEVNNKEDRKNIIETSKGNPRLAAIMAEVLRQGGNITKQKPYDIFKNYFEGVFSDLVDLLNGNYKEKALLALIAMLRTIHLNNEELKSKIIKSLSFDSEFEFMESIQNLEKYEIIETVSLNKTIKIFDDSVSEYIFYRYVLVDETQEVLNFDEFFNIFEKSHANYMFENLVTLSLKGYSSKKLNNVITALPLKTLDLLKKSDEENLKIKYLDWMKKYVQVNPAGCFRTIHLYWKSNYEKLSDFQVKSIVEICGSVMMQAWKTHLQFGIEFLKEVILYGKYKEAKSSALDILGKAFKYIQPVEYNNQLHWFYKHQELMLETVEKWLSKNMVNEHVSLTITMLSQLCENQFSSHELDYIDRNKIIMTTGGLNLTSPLSKLRTKTFSLIIKLFQNNTTTDLQRLDIIKALNLPFNSLPNGNRPTEELLKRDIKNLLVKLKELELEQFENLLVLSKLKQLLQRIKKYDIDHISETIMSRLNNSDIITFEKVSGIYWNDMKRSFNWRDVQEQRKEFAQNYAAKINEKGQIVDFLRDTKHWINCLSIEKKPHNQVLNDIIRYLSAMNIDLAIRLLSELKDNVEYAVLKSFLNQVLLGIGERDFDVLRDISIKLLSENNLEYSKAIANVYAILSPSNRKADDLAILRKLVDLADDSIDQKLVSTLYVYQEIDPEFVKGSLLKIIERCSEDTYSILLNFLEPPSNLGYLHYKYYETDIDYFKKIIMGSSRLNLYVNDLISYNLSNCIKYLINKESAVFFLEYIRARIAHKEQCDDFNYKVLSEYYEYSFVNEHPEVKDFYRGLLINLKTSKIKNEIIDTIVHLSGNESVCFEVFIEILSESSEWVDIVTSCLRRMPLIPEWFEVANKLTSICYDDTKLNRLYSAFHPDSFIGSGLNEYEQILSKIIDNKSEFTSFEMLSFLEQAEKNVMTIIEGLKEKLDGEENYI